MLSYLLAYNRYLNIVGIIAILSIAWIFSRARFSIHLRQIASAFILQVVTAYIILKTHIGMWIVSQIAQGATALYGYTGVGIKFLFGTLSDESNTWGFIFAFKVLPIMVFFGALTAVLFHLRIIQTVVGILSAIVRPLLATTGAETLCAVANSFLGQTESPLLVRNYLSSMTRSEMMVVMVSGMATVSGAIVTSFAFMGVPLEHLLTSCIMSVPGSILIAKILCPETERRVASNKKVLPVESSSDNIFGAIAKGTLDGLQLALNVGAMLISFLGLLALCNGALSLLCSLGVNYGLLPVSWLGHCSIQSIIGVFARPFAYVLGLQGQEQVVAAQLIGTKVAINELMAYIDMLSSNVLSSRTIAILTYALCGFSNFSCIGIQIGGIGALVPERRHLITQFGLYAVLGGTLTNLLNACIVSLFI